MSFAGRVVAELVHGASQATLLWAARSECPPCTCAPSLVCGPGQEAQLADCPVPQGTWPLSAVLLALAVGIGIGALGTWSTLCGPHKSIQAVAQAPDEQARVQAALVRARQQAQH